MDRQANEQRPTDGARIIVIGAGGGGSNAVDRMITAGLGGITLVAVNTDAQALQHSLAPTHIHLGEQITHGLGAGGNPLIGQQAATESWEALVATLHGADLVFITAGLGGGTGTGAAPVIAEIAQDAGALTVGVVTRPFAFEGAPSRTRGAGHRGAAARRRYADRHSE